MYFEIINSRTVEHHNDYEACYCPVLTHSFDYESVSEFRNILFKQSCQQHQLANNALERESITLSSGRLIGPLSVSLRGRVPEYSGFANTIFFPMEKLGKPRAFVRRWQGTQTNQPKEAGRPEYNLEE